MRYCINRGICEYLDMSLHTYIRNNAARQSIKRYKKRRAEKRQSVENPQVDLGSDEAYDLLTYGNDDGRIKKFGAIWKAISLISKAIAKTPLNFFESTDNGRQKVKGNISNLLLHEPNPETTAYIFKMQLMSWAVYHGNGYAYIERDEMMRVKALWLLNPHAVYPVRENGQMWYVVTVDNQPQLKLYPWEVLHIRGVGDELVGWSVKQLASVSFDIAAAAQKYGSKYFENGARPAVVIEHPAQLSDQAAKKLKSSWNGMYSGVDNSHRTAVLEEGMTVKSIASTAKDSMLIESMKFSIVDIANWFELPAHKLNDDAKSSYSSIEMENLNYLADTLDPWMVCFEHECRKKLLTEAEKENGSFYFEFNRNSIIQVDFKTRMEGYKTGLATAPFLTINEVREKENMNTVPEGDDIIFPSNNFGESTDGESNINDDESSRAADAAQKMLEHVKSRMITRLKSSLRKAGSLDIWLESFEEKHGEILRREIENPAAVIEALTGNDVSEKVISEIMEIVKNES